MARTHPPTLITLVRATLREHALAPRGTRVLVAVSGGPDSMALLHVLSGLRSAGGFGLFAHGVDHGLRPEAGAELDLAQALSRTLDVPFTRERVRLEPGGNLQARARDVRWGVFAHRGIQAGADRIATGHHAEDRAETLLMRLLRGTGTRGLAVLPPLDGARIRPLIRARRSDIDGHLARHGVPFARDPSNEDPRYLRTRVRRELVPQLERLSPRVVEHLCALADDAWAQRAGRAVPAAAGDKGSDR